MQATETTELYQMICQQIPEKSRDHPSDYERLTSEEKQVLRYWISNVMQPASIIDTKHSSYSLKHDFECEAFYVTNGQFKGAMLLEGHLPEHILELNWRYHVRRTVIRHRKGIEQEYPYDAWRYSLGFFDLNFAKLLIKAGHLSTDMPITAEGV